MNSAIQIAPARPQDAQAIADFQIAMALETENKTLDPATVLAGVQRLMANPQYGFYVVARTATEPVACLMITYEWTDWKDGLFWWIQSLYVQPAWRKHGIFKSMFTHIRDTAAASANCRGLRLYVETHNLPARKAYESLHMTPADYCMYEMKF